MKPMKPALIVHGGAWDIPNQVWDNHLRGVKASVEKGYEILLNGASALDTVEECVKILEMDPTFDAGRGSFLNLEGKIEMDAGIMDGRDLSCGAVGAVDGIYHPVSLARKVMEETEHVFLVGNGADEFAKAMGFEKIPYEKLLVGRELERWHQIKDNPRFKTRTVFEGKSPESIHDNRRPSDTVGAVAIDMNANIAAATSTGGTPKKMSGRVGDSPIIGCGLYADNETGGASATGWGEQLISVCMCKTAVDFITAGVNAPEAAKMAVENLEKRVGGKGGIIIVDRWGNLGYAYNTPRMAVDWRGDNSVHQDLRILKNGRL